MIGELYGYLKEGGSWILYEHVVVFPWQGWFLKKWQGSSSSSLVPYPLLRLPEDRK